LALFFSFSISAAEELNTVVSANNQFAFELYSKYRSKPGNVFFSPYSISTALAMTYEGAKGKTAEEMQSVFHFPSDDSRRKGNARIYSGINKKGRDYTLSTANALWAQKDYSFLANYFSIAEKFYSGKATNLDFVKDPEGSRQTINSWVEKQTNDKIKDLIPKGLINKLTRLVLTNAVYFKGNWLTQFDKEKTQEAPFRISPEKTVNAQMMAISDVKFNYTETQDLQMLELPYKGNELSMLVILPKEGKMEQVEQNLNVEKLNELKSGLRDAEIPVYLPKFKFETKYFMAQDLIDMGMPSAFDFERADFSGMTGSRDLYISSVIHQAFVEVNEEGTEAAAATAVIMEQIAAMPAVFRADRPFIFIIQQKDSGDILFMGKVNDPTKQ
jgi:serpin B